MKKLALVLLMWSMVPSLQAQFKTANLQATGLTCAMCSNAINKAVQKLAFVESVKADIKNSSFFITFKSGMEADIDALKNAVEGAGFSVGALQMNGSIDQLNVAADKHVKIGNNYFHFLNIKEQTLQGEFSIQVVDKGFVSAKIYKKYCGFTHMACMQTGKADNCCSGEGIASGTRIYHVTI